MNYGATHFISIIAQTLTWEKSNSIHFAACAWAVELTYISYWVNLHKRSVEMLTYQKKSYKAKIVKQLLDFY
jgi:hypothetical protein